MEASVSAPPANSLTEWDQDPGRYLTIPKTHVTMPDDPKTFWEDDVIAAGIANGSIPDETAPHPRSMAESVRSVKDRCRSSGRCVMNGGLGYEFWGSSSFRCFWLESCEGEKRMSTPGDVAAAMLNQRAEGANRDATAEELEAEAREKFLTGELRIREDLNPPTIELASSDGTHRTPRLATHPEMMAWRRLSPNERNNRQEVVDSTAEEIVERLDAEAPDLNKIHAVHQVPMRTTVHTFEQAVDTMLARCRQVMIDRQRKYGSRNITQSGQVGVMYQINNKYWRLDNLYFDADHNPLPLSAETPAEGMVKEDTFVDLANYAIIELMLRAGIWGLPLEENSGNSVQVPE